MDLKSARYKKETMCTKFVEKDRAVVDYLGR
jgi:hypothetical protein